MKKYIAILAIVTIVFTCALAFSACKTGELTLYVPDGAPALSVAKIISDGKVSDNKVKTVVTTGEDVVAKCASGEADLAVLPTNSAVKICNTRSDYLLFSVNVYGVLYVVGTEHIDSFAELTGQTLYSIGQANTPEYVFKTICDNLQVNYVDGGATSDKINIVYQADASTIIPQILNGSVKFALIGEPAVTQLQNKAQAQGKNVEMLFDLQQEWQVATGASDKGYPQASMIVKKQLLTDAFATQLNDCLQANYQFAITHCEQLNGIMRGAGSLLDVNYTEQLLARCNLTAILAKTAKSDVERYLEAFCSMANYLPLSDSIIYDAQD